MRKNHKRLPNGRILTSKINSFEDFSAADLNTVVDTASKVKSESGIKSSTADDLLEVGKTAAAGAAIGATVGSAVPVIGTVVGGAVGAVLGSAIKTAEILFSGPGGKERRLEREKKRQKADAPRIKAYKNFHTPKEAYKDYLKGKIVFTMGTPGSQKENETGSFRYEDGTIVEKDGEWVKKYFGMTKGYANPHKDKIYLGSIAETAKLLKTVKEGEDYWAKQAQKTIPKAELNKAMANVSAKLKSLVSKPKSNTKTKSKTVEIKSDSLAKLAKKPSLDKSAKKLKDLAIKLKSVESNNEKILTAGNKKVTSLELTNKALLKSKKKIAAALGIPFNYV
jgi:hypothetical protein